MTGPGVAFRQSGQHIQVNLEQPFTLRGAPVGINILLHVVAPVEILRFFKTVQRFVPLLLALQSQSFGSAPLKRVQIHPHRVISERIGLAGRFHDVFDITGGA